jgi:hypothetical protein
MREKWIVEDWMGRRLFPDQAFGTFEDGWEFLRGRFPDEGDWEEMFVVRVEAGQ